MKFQYQPEFAQSEGFDGVGVGDGLGDGVGVGEGVGQDAACTFMMSQVEGASRPQDVSFNPLAGLYGAITVELSLHPPLGQ